MRKSVFGLLAMAVAAGLSLGASAKTIQYRYYRFKVEATKSSSAGMMQLSELKLFNGEADVTASRVALVYDSTTKTIAGATYPAAENPEMIVDGNVGTKWLDNRCAAGQTQRVRDAVALALDFGAPQPITAYEWYTANDAVERDPSAWRLQGSADGSTWVDIDSRSNFDATGDRNSRAYRWDRPDFSVKNTVNGSHDFTALGEVVVDAFPTLEGYSDYQIVVGRDAEPTGIWNSYATESAPTNSIAFDLPQTLGETVTFTLYVRGADVETKTYYASIASAYGAYPAASVSGDITVIAPNAVDGALVTAEQIKALSTCSDSYGGIVELIAEDTAFHSSGTVTLTARNLAGNTSSVEANVTVIPYRGLITEDNGYLQNMLHLGANFDSDDLQQTGIDTDQLAAYDGQAHQNPWAGLVYTGLSTQGGEPAGQLTWTPARTTLTGGQTWVPNGRDHYIKFWHAYVDCPEERTVRLCTYSDDDIRVWVNGELKVSHGYATSVKDDGVVLRKGLNSITVKLNEGDGGDFMGISIRPQDGSSNRFPDLYYQYCPDFLIEDAEGGSGFETGSGAVKVRYMPKYPGYTQYQIVQEGVNPSPDGWKAYDPHSTPSDEYAYETPAADGDAVAFVVYLKDDSGSATTNFTASLAYSTVAPELVVKDYTCVVANREDGREILERDVVQSCTAPSGFRIELAPNIVRADTDITVTAYAKSGASATAVAHVTTLEGSGPLPQGYIRTMLHLGHDFNTDDLRQDGGIGGDQLASAGGQTDVVPFAGMVMTGLNTSGTSREPAGQLTWTPCFTTSDRWEPAGRDNYIKYWCIYIFSPDEREVHWRHLSDDGMRLWVNGELQVSADGVSDGTTAGRLYEGLNRVIVKLEEGGGGDYLNLALRDTNNGYFTDLTYQFYPGDFLIEDAVTGDGSSASSGAIKVRYMPAATGYVEYQIVPTGTEPASDGWLEYEPGMKPEESYAYEYPAPGAPISFTLYLRDGEGNTKESTATITSRNNFQDDIAFKSDEFFSEVTGTALVPAGSTAILYYGTDRTSLGDSIEMEVGEDGFSGTIEGLDDGTTYFWAIEVYEGSRLSGTGTGSFTTLRMIQHGDAAEIGAQVTMIDDDVILYYADNGKVEFSRDTEVEMLLVGGGGGGGSWVGGGGGGGGVLHLENFVVPAGKYLVKVGAGGDGANWEGTIPSSNGGDSFLVGLESSTTAFGGGAGGGSEYTDNYWNGSNAGANGGSGGGASGHVDTGIGGYTPGLGISGQGNGGGVSVVEGFAGGGGGAGAAGGGGNASDSQIGGKGGDGVAIDITGDSVYYGGGGGGGCATYGGWERAAQGGLGGGGNGGFLNSGSNGAMPGTDGVDGLGGGGGGAGKSFGYNGQTGYGGGNGGKGVVVIRFTQRYSGDSKPATGGNEILKVDGWMVHIFRENGTFTIPDSAKVEVFMVGGGGKGGWGYLCGGGGGGAGGVVQTTGVNVMAGEHAVIVGEGGTGNNDSDMPEGYGKPSTFNGLTAFGGGSGGSLFGSDGRNGGSGGGAAGGGHDYCNRESFGGAAVEGQGFPGGDNMYGRATTNIVDDVTNVVTEVAYLGAGGGGAGGPGGKPGDHRDASHFNGDGVDEAGKYYAGFGGDGVMNDWTGEELWYAAGGGGGDHNAYWCAPCGLGGKGGGGNGGFWAIYGAWWGDGNNGAGLWTGTIEAQPGAPNTGSGGGGGYMDWGNRGASGGDGGSGIVLIRYKLRLSGTLILLK